MRGDTDQKEEEKSDWGCSVQWSDGRIHGRITVNENSSSYLEHSSDEFRGG